MCTRQERPAGLKAVTRAAKVKPPLAGLYGPPSGTMAGKSQFVGFTISHGQRDQPRQRTWGQDPPCSGEGLTDPDPLR